jgi:hypothetical protein
MITGLGVTSFVRISASPLRASQDNSDVPAYLQATSSRLDLGCGFTIRLNYRGIKYAAVPSTAPDVTRTMSYAAHVGAH